MTQNVTLTGHHQTPQGANATGKVVLTLTEPLYDTDGVVVVDVVPVTLSLSSGSWTTVLRATDDPALRANTALYRLDVVLDGELPRTVYLPVRYANGASQDIVNISPVTPTGPYPTSAEVPYKGNWTSGVSYLADDLVTDQGVLYRVTSGHVADGNHPDLTKMERMTGNPVPQVGSLRAVGHSYLDTGAVTKGGAGKNYTIGRLMTAFGLHAGRVENLALSGSTARWGALPLMLNKYNPGAQSAPRTADTGVGVVWWGTNDAISGGAAGSWQQYSYEQGVKATIARFRAGAVYENDHSSVAYTGSWTTTLLADIGSSSASGISVKSSTVTADKVTITTPNDMGRYLSGSWVTLGFIGAQDGAKAEVWLDGVKHGDVNCGRGAAYGTAFGHPYGNGALYTSPVVYRMWIPTTYADVNNRTTTTHTIEVRHAGNVGAGGSLIFDYWSIDADEPPVVLCLSMTQPPNPGAYWASLMDPAVHDTYNGWLKGVVSSFSSASVRYVDVDWYLNGYSTVWEAPAGLGSPGSNQRWFSTDGLHPNAEGAKVIAEACVDEVAAALHRGVSPRSLLGYWKNESDVITEPLQLHKGAGVPLNVYDSFDAGAAGSLSGWTEDVGAWGLDSYGQSYISDSGVKGYRLRDNFDRQDSSSSLGSIDSDTLSATPPAWTVRTGTWGISSSEGYLVTPAGGAAPNLATVDLASTTQAVEYEIVGWDTTANIGYGGVCLRYSDTDNYLALYVGNFIGLPLVNLVKKVAGVETQVLSLNDWTHWDYTKIRLEVGSDNIVRVWAGDGSKVEASTYTITDSALQASNASATHVGLYARSSCTTAFKWRKFIAGTSTATTAARDAVMNVAVVDSLKTDGVVGGVIGGEQGISGRATTGQGFVFRYQDQKNFMALTFNDFYSIWTVNRYNAGVPTRIGTYVADSLVGDEVSVSYNSGTIVVYRNGTALKEYYTGLTTATDGAPLSGTKVGLCGAYTTGDPPPRWRDFRFGDYMPTTAARPGDLAWDTIASKLYGPYSTSGGWGSGIALGGGGGATDHGLLTGLGDDDHTQYLNNARGDARYDALGAASTGDAAHVAAGDPHTQYHTDARGDARYSLLGHNHSGTYAPVSHTHKGQVTCVIDGGGAVITTGLKAWVEVPFDGTITGWTVLADVAGDLVVDVWKDTFGNFPPTGGDSIAGSEKPSLVAARTASDLTLSTWTTTVTAGDVIAFNVDSAATVTKASISLHITRST